MFAERFAQFVLKRRLHAALLAVIFSCLPFFGWISAVIVGLVVIRKGLAEGFVILLWSALPSVVLAFVSHDGLVLASRLLMSGVLVWVLAALFMRKPNWIWTVNLTMIFGVICVLLFHVFVKDVPAWWLHYLSQNATALEQDMGMNSTQQAAAQVLANRIANFATGMNMAVFGLTAIVEMIFVRALDLRLPNPIHKSREQRKVKLPRAQILLLVLAIFLAAVGPQIFLDILPVIVLPYIVAGLSLINGYVIKRFSPIGVMVFYIVLLVIFFVMPVIIGMIAVMGMVDSFIDFRARWSK